MRKNNKNSGGKTFKSAAILLIVLVASVMGMSGCGGSSETASEPEPIINPLTGIESESELPARPVMVSIPNAPDGAVPQSNISDADMIYEIPVEGQLTRLQAIFYTDFPDMVGPIRSVRYYFVDLAREYKAAHVGYGWGKKARGYMESSGVPHINGMQDTDLFYRSDEKAAPNNAYIKWSEIEGRADKEGWFDTPQKIKPFKFRDAEWKSAVKAEKQEAEATIESLKDSKDAEDVKAVEKAENLLKEPEKAGSVKVSSIGCKSECKYNEETGLYDRFWYGAPYVDKETGEQLSFSNILVQKVHSTIMTDSDTGMPDEKGRLELDLNGSGEAYLFTNGEVVKGTWEKKDPDGRTIFKDENGRQFRLTPGKTWVYVVDGNLDFSYE